MPTSNETIIITAASLTVAHFARLGPIDPASKETETIEESVAEIDKVFGLYVRALKTGEGIIARRRALERGYDVEPG